MHRLLHDLSDNLRGALWMLASVAGATGMTIMVRELSPALHSAMIAFLRSAVGLVFLVPLFLRSDALARLRMRRPWLHLLRGGLIALALNTGFYAIWKLPVATATILFFLAPVFSTMLAPLMVGERVGPQRWSAVALGFVGALVVLRPGTDTLNLASIAAVGSSLLFAVSLLLGKIMTREDGSDAVFLSSALVTVLLTMPMAVPTWTWPTALWVWIALLALAAASSLRGYADIRAFAVGEASFVGPVSYLRLPAVGFAGWWLYGERIDTLTLVGGGIIAGSTLWIMLRESRLGRPTLP
jgi:drug/metabolite transporter (DMT)-like permease